MASKRFGQGLSCTWKSDEVLYKQVTNINLLERYNYSKWVIAPNYLF